MSHDDAALAVHARRKATNRLIAEHKAAALRAFFADGAVVIVGDGGLITGVEAIVAAFAAQFREPGFGAFERIPDSVEIAEDGRRAAEAGRWTGRWLGRPAMGGRYLAAWALTRSQWVIEQEMFVTLAG
jgi:hypothetical protein